MVRAILPDIFCRNNGGQRGRLGLLSAGYICVLALCASLGITHAKAQEVPNITVNLGALNALPPLSPPSSAAIPQDAPIEAPKSRLDLRLAAGLGLLPDQRPAFLGPTQPLPPPETPVLGEPETRSESTAAVPQNNSFNVEPVTPPRERVNQAPPSEPVREELVMRIGFQSASAILVDDNKEGLREIAAAMQSNTGLGLKLLAYAERENETELFARRLSLSRSLAVRNFLIAEGIEQTRIIVQALGATEGVSDGGDIGENRVDAYIIRR